MLPADIEHAALDGALHLAREVSAIDQGIIASGVPAIVLMKRAGRSALALLQHLWPEVAHLHVVCGSGNNGGDGYIVAAQAHLRQIPVTLWYHKCPSTQSAQQAHDYAVQEGVKLRKWQAQAFVQSVDGGAGHVIVDALLGIGSQGGLSSDYQQMTAAINQAANQGAAVMALDIPTGVNPDTGDADPQAVLAGATLSFIAAKRGLFTHLGRLHSGKRYLSRLASLASKPEAKTYLLDRSKLPALPCHGLLAHKGERGRLLVVGGDQGVGYSYGGAPLMAAQMALRAGAGIVSLAVRPQVVAGVLARQPECMAVGVEHAQALLPLLPGASALVVGPGLGRSAWSEQLLYHVLSHCQQPLVLDADALRLLPKLAELAVVEKTKRQWILTPHPGEAASLLGCEVADIQMDRFKAAQAIAKRYGGVVVLKGAGTVVADEKHCYVCDVGHPAMATAGMGDVLSGLLGALLVQQLPLMDAACLGVLAHASAADAQVARAGRIGLVASDVISQVRIWLNDHAN